MTEAAELTAPGPEEALAPAQAPAAESVRDGFGRTVDYLRLSVTDRCNERCVYCMPDGYQGWARTPDHLTADEIVAIAAAAAGLGFRKFRLTGGEPLVRRDIAVIAARIWDLAGVETLGLSTNGLLLERLARPLRQAGVRSVNVSLDTVDPDAYRGITGHEVAAVIRGIDAALAAGFECVKLNTVLVRGMNDGAIGGLLEFAGARGLPLRFIELMPLAPGDARWRGEFWPVSELKGQLERGHGLVPSPETRVGHGPAKYFRVESTGAIVGFVGSLSDPCFCQSCNKVRVTADGFLRPCLGRHGEIDLKPALRGGWPAALEDLLRLGVASKPEDHEFSRGYAPRRPMTAIGG